ncbi:hypothetical protein D3C83_09130 [compost metagenome]
MHRAECEGSAVAGKAGFGGDQRDRGEIALLGLRRDVAHRFVEQDGDARFLARLRLFRQRDLLVGEDARAELGDRHAVHQHPAALDVAVGLAAGAEALLGHELGDSYLFH